MICCFRGKDGSYELHLGSVSKYAGRRHVVERVVRFPRNSFLNLTSHESQILSRYKELKDLLPILEINDTNKSELGKLYQEYKDIRNSETLEILMKSYTWFWDIALLKVKNRIIPAFNETHYTINSICLPKSGIENQNNESLVIIGMGYEDPYASLPYRLKKGVTQMLDSKTCETISREFYKNICFLRLSSNKPILNSSSCSGDLGSPSHQYYGCRAIQIGVHSKGVSGSESCDRTGEGGQTRVSLWTQWIRSVIYKERDNQLIRCCFMTTVQMSCRNELRGQCIKDKGIVMALEKGSVVAKTKSNVLLKVSAITTTIIAVVVSSVLLWRKSYKKYLKKLIKFYFLFISFVKNSYPKTKRLKTLFFH